MKLAVKWKENVLANSEDPWDIFNFLQFLHTYGLFSSFDNDDILKLLEMISRREDDLVVCRALKFADAIPGKVSQTLLSQPLVLRGSFYLSLRPIFCEFLVYTS